MFPYKAFSNTFFVLVKFTRPWFEELKTFTKQVGLNNLQDADRIIKKSTRQPLTQHPFEQKTNRPQTRGSTRSSVESSLSGDQNFSRLSTPRESRQRARQMKNLEEEFIRQSCTNSVPKDKPIELQKFLNPTTAYKNNEAYVG